MPWVVKHGTAQGHGEDSHCMGMGVLVTDDLQQALDRIEVIAGPEVEAGRRVWALMRWVEP